MQKKAIIIAAIIACFPLGLASAASQKSFEAQERARILGGLTGSNIGREVSTGIDAGTNKNIPPSGDAYDYSTTTLSTAQGGKIDVTSTLADFTPQPDGSIKASNKDELNKQYRETQYGKEIGNTKNDSFARFVDENINKKTTKEKFGIAAMLAGLSEGATAIGAKMLTKIGF